MLILARREGSRVRLKMGDDIVWITAVECEDGKTRLGFEAPRSVEIMRDELLAPHEQHPTGDVRGR